MWQLQHDLRPPPPTNPLLLKPGQKLRSECPSWLYVVAIRRNLGRPRVKESLPRPFMRSLLGEGLKPAFQVFDGGS